MAQDESERESTGATRTQHIVYTLPHGMRSLARVVRPAIDRIDAAAEGTQLVVVVPDAETAHAVADIARGGGDDAPDVIPVSGTSRARRVLATRGAPAVAGTAADLLELLRGSALKLENVRTLVIAWADDVLAHGDAEALESVLAELPKEGARIVLAEEETEAVAALVEAHMRRARRITETGESETELDLPLRYVATTPAGRGTALRRLLDELDPPSAIIIARDARSAIEARSVLRTLGYRENDPDVRVTAGEVEPNASLVVFYDAPTAAEELAAVAEAMPSQAVAFVQPRGVRSLRRIAPSATPLPSTGQAARARGAEESLRSALRAELAAGFPAREMLALEPLLSEFDGAEVAAAALRLLDRERAKASAGASAPAARPPAPRAGERNVTVKAPPAHGEMTRVYLSVGEIDGARAGDIVGAVTGEAGITREQVGKVEVRGNHSLVEVATAEAERVVAAMEGATVKGRRLVARVDKGRPADEEGEAPARRPRTGGADRGAPRGGARGERPTRSGPRGDRPPARGGDRERPFRSSGDRDDRPFRGGGARGGAGARGGFGARSERGPSDRGAPRGRGPAAGGRSADDRGPRGGDRDEPPRRQPRAQYEREEWKERGERMRNAKRPRGRE